jgi:phosphotriesterase-related protein
MRTGVPALEALIELGVAPAKIVIAHAGDSDDLGYLRAIAQTGAALGYDRFNMVFYAPDATRITTLLALLADGYGDRIHLAHDASAFFDVATHNPLFADEVLDYLHISNTILPTLLDRGVTQRQIDEMLIDNPQRYFGNGRS